MQVLTSVTLFDVLRDWGLHEATGRLPAIGLIEPALVDALRRGGDDAAIRAVEICLQARTPVITRVLAADPSGYAQVELMNEDIEHLFVMSAEGQPRRPLRADAEERATGADEDNEWTREKIAKGEPVERPLFAVGRAVPGELTILDGIHRAAVWVKHAEAGLLYSVTANVTITSRRVWYEGS